MLDGKNFRDFMAAIGVAHVTGSRLHFDAQDHAQFSLPQDEILDALEADKAKWRESELLNGNFLFCSGCWGTPETGHLLAGCVPPKVKKPKPFRNSDFTPLSPDLLGEYVSAVNYPLNSDPRPFLHLLAGPMNNRLWAKSLADCVTREQMKRDLFEEYPIAQKQMVAPNGKKVNVSSFRWDNHRTRVHVRQATQPETGDLYNWPGKEWLAFRGWPLIPELGRDGFIDWPLWKAPLDPRTIQLLLLSDSNNSPTGVAWYRSERYKEGDYGNLRPASRVL